MNAYTYHLKWTNKGMAYYGVRYAKNCDPSDLWVTYHTSSKHVTDFVNKHGDPDFISIRKTFGSDTDRAREWENKVIRRRRMVEDKGYLNHTNNIAIPVVEFDRAKNFRNDDPTRKRFEDFPQELQDQLRKEASIRATQQHEDGRVNYSKPEDTTNYRKAAKKRWSDPSFKKKMKSKKWMNLEGKSKMIFPEEVESYLSMGWSFGRGG